MELKSINFYEFKEQCVIVMYSVFKLNKKLVFKACDMCYQELEKDYFNFDKASVLIRDWD